jgi:hypothetical protein
MRLGDLALVVRLGTAGSGARPAGFGGVGSDSTVGARTGDVGGAGFKLAAEAVCEARPAVLLTGAPQKRTQAARGRRSAGGDHVGLSRMDGNHVRKGAWAGGWASGR